MLFHYFVCVLDKSSSSIDNFVQAQFSAFLASAVTNLLITGKLNLPTSETAFYLFYGPPQCFLAK